MTDPVNHPSHYTWLPNGVEVIDITETLGFNLGNVVKYVLRADHKGRPLEDLRKAEWYVQREIQRRTKAVDIAESEQHAAWLNNEGDACPTKTTLVNSAASETAGAPSSRDALIATRCTCAGGPNGGYTCDECGAG